MNTFMYFISKGGGSVQEESLRQVGLSHLATPDVQYEQVQCMQGPDGGHGTLFRATPKQEGVKSPETKFGFWPETQTWYKCGDNLRIGLENGVEYTPADFVRPEPIGEYLVAMADYEEGMSQDRWWLIPSIPALPVRHMMNPDGTKRLVNMKEHRAACEAADRMFQSFLTPNAREKDAESTQKDLCEILSINYRIGWWESQILGLFSAKSCWVAMEAALGLDKIKEIMEFHMKLAEQSKNVETGSGDSLTPPSSDTAPSDTTQTTK